MKGERILDLWIHVLESGWRIHCSDERRCRVQSLSNNIFEYSFEDWDDWDYNEPRLKVRFLSGGKVQITVLKHTGAWHCDVYVGERKVLQNVCGDSVGESVVAQAAYVGEPKPSYTTPLEFRNGVVIRPFLKRERKMRVKERRFPLSSVTFLAPSLEEPCGIATYTGFLMEALKPTLAVDACRNIQSVKGLTLIHVQHEFGVFPSLSMITGNPVVTDWPKIVTWHTINKNFDHETSEGLNLREYVGAVDDDYDAHIVHASLAKTWLMKEVNQPVHIIPHGTLLWANKSKLEARKSLSLPLDSQIVFAFGFAGELKGLLDLERIMLKLRECYPRLLLVISGATHPRAVKQCEEYKGKLASLAGRRKGIILLGKYLTEEEINLYSDASDILAFNYQHVGDFSSASGAAHRVIGAGKPIVCSNDPRMNEFQEGIHCLKYPIGDWDGLESAIDTLLTDHGLAEEIAMNVKLLARATSWENVALRHMQVYQSITEGMEVYGPQYYGEEYFAGSKGGLRYLTESGQMKQWSYYNPDGEWLGAKPIMEAIKSLLNPKNMLDIGCGRGTFTAYAKEAGIDATGIDFSRWAIEHSYARAKGLIRLGDIRNIEFPDQSFDLAFCTDIMEHIYEEDLDKAVNEIQRVAKKWIFYNIGSTMTEDSEYFVLKRGEVPPVHWQGTAVAGHVNVRPPSYWRKKVANENWRLRDDLVQKFRELVPREVLRNWVTIIIVERA